MTNAVRGVRGNELGARSTRGGSPEEEQRGSREASARRERECGARASAAIRAPGGRGDRRFQPITCVYVARFSCSNRVVVTDALSRVFLFPPRASHSTQRFSAPTPLPEAASPARRARVRAPGPTSGLRLRRDGRGARVRRPPGRGEVPGRALLGLRQGRPFDPRVRRRVRRQGAPRGDGRPAPSRRALLGRRRSLLPERRQDRRPPRGAPGPGPDPRLPPRASELARGREEDARQARRALRVAAQVRRREHPPDPQARLRRRQGVLPARVPRPNQGPPRGAARAPRPLRRSARGGAPDSRSRRRSRRRRRRARLLRPHARVRQDRPEAPSQRPGVARGRHVPPRRQRHELRGVRVPPRHGRRQLRRVPRARAQSRHRQPAERLRPHVERVLAADLQGNPRPDPNL